jgi:hypothetical protein
MKTVIASAVSLFLGLGLGWYFEHHRAERVKAESVELVLNGSESADSESAARAARAIQFIQSGDTQQAVQLLSTPAAHYYAIYTTPGVNEPNRSATRALIEQVAKTNPILATRIAEVSSDLQHKVP